MNREFSDDLEVDYETLCNDNWEDYPDMQESDLRFQLALLIKAASQKRSMNCDFLASLTRLDLKLVRRFVSACHEMRLVVHRGRKGREFCCDFSEDYPWQVWKAVDELVRFLPPEQPSYR